MSSLFAIGAVATFGMLVLLVGSVLAVSQRRNRFQIDKLEGAVPGRAGPPGPGAEPKGRGSVRERRDVTVADRSPTRGTTPARRRWP